MSPTSCPALSITNGPATLWKKYPRRKRTPKIAAEKTRRRKPESGRVRKRKPFRPDDADGADVLRGDGGPGGDLAEGVSEARAGEDQKPRHQHGQPHEISAQIRRTFRQGCPPRESAMHSTLAAAS